MTETSLTAPGQNDIFRNTHWGKLMMWFFLASDVMGFASLIAGYFYLRMLSPDWPDNWELLNLGLTSVNTVFLLASSLTMAWSVAAIKRNDRRLMLRHLGATIFWGRSFWWFRSTSTWNWWAYFPRRSMSGLFPAISSPPHFSC